MSTELQEHSQVTTAIWGTMMDVSPLDSNQRSYEARFASARPKVFKEGISGTVTFILKSGEGTGESCWMLETQLWNSS